MRFRLAVALLLVVVLVALTGCGAQPRLAAEDVDTVQYWSLFDDRKKSASADEVRALVEAYNEAKPLKNDDGTTPPARVDVTLKSGERLTIWGGGQHFQTIKWHGKQSNILGEKLGELLEEIASPKMRVTRGEHVTVEGYDIVMVSARLLDKPVPGPDLAGVPSTPDGFLVCDIRLEIKNAANADGKSLPIPRVDEVSLVDSSGTRMRGGGVGVSRSMPTPLAPRHRGPSAMIGTPLRPGEVLYLEPQFVVPASARRLTFSYSPSRKRPELVLEYAVK